MLGRGYQLTLILPHTRDTMVHYGPFTCSFYLVEIIKLVEPKIPLQNAHAVTGAILLLPDGSRVLPDVYGLMVVRLRYTNGIAPLFIKYRPLWELYAIASATFSGTRILNSDDASFSAMTFGIRFDCTISPLSARPPRVTNELWLGVPVSETVSGLIKAKTYIIKTVGTVKIPIIHRGPVVLQHVRPLERSR
ncbi:hypothetical protein AX14_007279 [Amanita brunnescens Koide BX004]|nr:hypothetical protein AX14_007279 [Amanita brunnescens Koide BX004]